MKKKNDILDNKLELIDDPLKKESELKRVNLESLTLIKTETMLTSQLHKIEMELRTSTQHDPDIIKPDTVHNIKIQFDKIITNFNIINTLSGSTKEKFYHLIFNISIIFYEYLHAMRLNKFSIHCIKYFTWLITQFESIITLSGIKYLKWKNKIYSELAFCYEDNSGFKSSLRVITQAINKVNEIKLIQDQQQNLPDYIKITIEENLRFLKNLEMKYLLLSGNLNIDSFKKKLEESFNPNDKLNKLICAINSIHNLSNYNSIIFHDGLVNSNNNFNKSQYVLYIYDMIKSDLNLIKNGIQDHIQKNKRELEKREKINNNPKEYLNILEENNKIDQNLIKNWKNVTKLITIELHMELLKSAYDCKLWKEFNEILESLEIRIKFRNVETPYISEIDILVSSIPFPNIPNKYEKIEIDLNVNNYKAEIRKLREMGKYVKIEENVNGVNKNEKENANKNDKNKKDNNINNNENLYEKIENLEHSYVYLILRRTHNPNKAIINFRIVMSNDIQIKHNLEKGERAFAIPIKTYDNNLYEKDDKEFDDIKEKINFEKNKLSPYLVYKKTDNGLQNESEKLNALVDILPMISNSPFQDAVQNYKKDEVELSIVKNLIKNSKNNKNINSIYDENYNFNHNYINFCYKTDDVFYIIKSEFEILKYLNELENSFIENINSPEYKNSTTKSDQFLQINFPIEKLENLSKILFNSIQGTLGKYFLKMRRNFIYDTCIFLWKKYLKEILTRFDYFYLIQSELEENLNSEINEKIILIQSQIFEIIYNIHNVMLNINLKDPIIFSNLSLRLADWAEKTENFNKGNFSLEKTLEFLNKFRENENLFGLSNYENKNTFTQFTCDNNKIDLLNKMIEEKYSDFVREINFKFRRTLRKNDSLKLNIEEEKEEDFENFNLENEYEMRMKNINKKVIEKFEIDESDFDEKIKVYLTENENTLNCLFVELTVRYYKLYLKNGLIEKFNNNLNISNNSTINNSKYNASSSIRSNSLKKAKMSNSTLKKLDMIKGPTANNIKSSIDYLKQSLQDAGKMEPDKPILQPYEKKMINQINKNIYLNCLFNLTIANSPLHQMDTKYFLNHSYNLLKKCFDEEDSRFKYYLENFRYIKSFEKFNKNLDQNMSTFYPYNLLYKEVMINNYEKIPEPILINKTHNSATFMFPIVKVKTDQIEANYKTTRRVAIFGQESTGSNIVQLNNNELDNSGKIISVFDYITVNNLKPNEKYIFAYAGYDLEDTLINGIGQTSKEVESYPPLNLFFISYHFCKMAYDNKLFEICRNQAKIVFLNFTEKSELQDQTLDNSKNQLFFYKLKYENILRTCFLELEGISHTFLMYAKSLLLLKQNDHDDSTGVNLITKQKNVLKNLNILLLGLEIASYIRNFNLIKLFSKEIYNLISPFMNQSNLYSQLHQILFRLSICINLIPNEMWDINLRNISSMISYLILIISVNNNEVDLFRKVLISELGIEKKRFYYFKYDYMKKNIINEKNKDKNKIQSNEELVEAEGVLLKDLEKESQELDEFILFFGDFNDLMKNRINQHINNLEKYSINFIQNNELVVELEKRKKELNEIVDIYDNFKLEGIKFVQRFCKEIVNEKYYEYCSKLLKKLIETIISQFNNSITNLSLKKDTKDNKDNQIVSLVDLLKLSDEIIIKESDSNFVQNIFNQKINFINNDIIFIMKMRIKEFLDKVEKEIISSKNSKNKNNEGEINLENIRIQIEQKYFGSSIENEKDVPYYNLTINEVFYIKEKYFYIADLLFNKAILLNVEFTQIHKSLLNFDFNNFLSNYRLVDIAKINYSIDNKNEFNLNSNIEKDNSLRHKRLSKIFEKLAFASLFMKEVNAMRSFDNLLYFAYNLLIYDMKSPTETLEENFWTFLNILSENAIKRLEKIKRGEEDFFRTDYKKEVENLKKRLKQTKDSNFSTQYLNFNIFKKSEQNSKVNFIIDEKLIETYEEKINFDVYIEFICFTIQSTFYAKKWNILSNLIQNFNNVTNDEFCDFTLTYLIEAQRNIYDKSNENMKEKLTEINQRVLLYETWKNSRKKNKRQQMITGEIPQEQIDFERDHNILSKELFILESIANLLKSDLEKSQKQFNNMINDSNNSYKAINACRKLFEKYQMESLNSNLKGIKLFQSNLINLYKKAIVILRKRQENYLLIQMIYEMSIIYYSDKDYKNSEVFFNESLDTVFQKLYSLKDFRNLFEINKNLAEKFGIRQLFYAVLNLHKMAKFCYDNDLYWQRECALMSAEIIFNILNVYIPNPGNILNYGSYRINEINKNLNVFKSSENVKVSDLIISLIELSDILINYGDFESTLPLLTLSEYLSCDIVKNLNYLHKSRIMKIVALSELGMINEAMQIYYKIVKKLDLPNFIQNSLIIEKTTGRFTNLNKDFKFYNNLSVDNPKNLECLNLFNKLYPDSELKLQLGSNLFLELNYAKILIIFKIFEKDNYSIEKFDTRLDNLNKIEKECRDSLIICNTNEELNSLNMLMKYFKLNSNSNNDMILKKIDEISNNKKITKEEIDYFYLAKFNKDEIELRKERIDLICKFRILISKINLSQNLYLSSSGVVLKNLENLKKFCKDNMIIGVEVGDDYTYVTTNSKTANKNITQNKDNKDNKGNNKTNPIITTPIINIDEELNKLFNTEIISNNTRFHPNSIFWFKLHLINVNNMFKMSRYEDCLESIKRLTESSQQINDTYFYIRFKEIEAMIHLLNYNLKDFEKSYEDIKIRMMTNFVNDLDYSIFLANISEFLITIDPNRALNLIKESRMIIWLKMSKMNYSIHPQNNNNNKILNYIMTEKSLKNILKERENLYSNNNSSTNKKDPKKKEDKNEILPINWNQILDFSKNEKIEDILEQPIKEINDSDEGFNLYFKFTDLLCKIDLRFVYYQLIYNPNEKLNLEILNSVLNDLLIISNKILNPHNSFKIILFFLLSKIHKLNFIYDLNDYLHIKMNKIIKKFNLEIISRKEILIKFSNFYNERCQNVWLIHLNKSKEILEKSLILLKSEFFYMELGFGAEKILSELSDVNILLSEYRPNLIQKFCDINQIVMKVNTLIKINKYYNNPIEDLIKLEEDDLPLEIKNEKNNFIVDRNNNEKLICKNLIRNAISYSEMANKVISIKKLLNENIFELANANLIDPSKIPKEIFNQILENDYLNKKRNKNYLNLVTQKNIPDSFDVFYIMKNLIRESEFFTINNDEVSKSLAKLHKYLKLNSTNYANKCYYEINPISEISDLNLEIVKKDQLVINWIFTQNEIINQSVSHINKIEGINLVYILGSNSVFNEYKDFVFGRVFLDRNSIVHLNKNFVDLKINLKFSLLQSEQKKKRDLKYHQIEYNRILSEFCYEFLKAKKIYSDFNQLEKTIKKELFGEVNIENVEFWINFTNLNTYIIINQRFNQLIYDLHLKLFN